jgi:hypothetical protein
MSLSFGFSSSHDSKSGLAKFSASEQSPGRWFIEPYTRFDHERGVVNNPDKFANLYSLVGNLDSLI